MTGEFSVQERWKLLHIASFAFSFDLFPVFLFFFFPLTSSYCQSQMNVLPSSTKGVACLMAGSQHVVVSYRVIDNSISTDLSSFSECIF